MVEEFLEYNRYEKNRSPRTIQNYADAITDFQRYFSMLDTGMTWETVDADVIRDWMEWQMNNGIAASSIDTRLSAIRSLYKFALSRGFVDKDPAHEIAGPKKSKSLPQYLREDEMNKLLDDFPWGVDYKSILARTVIMTFYETGIRCSELVGMNDNSVDFIAKQIKVLGKRNKQRLVPFGSELEAAFRKYLDVRNETFGFREEGFFLSVKGKRVSGAQVYKMVREHLRSVCTLKKCSPHVLRHTFATAMLNHNAGLENVKELLGHESVATTEIYTHTTFEQLKRVYAESHPRLG
ncbi:MAG: tyrosine-type recombinase/integrase [Prevotella sp.]|jgi:integrase/recombinase XerC|nr:tyrosine-type recombinase/integrase [Prevotella sp.]